MVFTNLFFLYLFLPLCLIIYYCVKRVRARNIILLVFSLLFYIWGEPFWILLLLFSAVFNWYMGIQISRFLPEKFARSLTIFSVAINILLLAGFKYIGILSGLMSESSFPLGISIFTLQAISYILDCYHETVVPQEKFWVFLTYFTLFPQMIAGPIVRYSEISSFLDSRKASAADLYEGIVKFIIGLTKTVLIAGNLLPIIRRFFGTDIAGLSMLGTWYALILFCLFLYYEFSGFSDMAIGIARLFGFRYEENFDHPYMCRTITEFWQRWFISAGSFFRDYTWKAPLAKKKRYAAFFLVWMCIGLWFGTGWNALVWGIFCGAFILIEQLIGEERLLKWPVWVKHIYSKLVLLIGFGIFFFKDPEQLGYFFLNITGLPILTGSGSLTDPLLIDSLTGNLFLIIAALLFCAPVRERLTESYIHSKNETVFTRARIVQMICCIILLVICTILLAGNPDKFLDHWRM